MKALNAAMHSVFGISGSFAGIDFAGRTDPLIIRQIFDRFGIPHSRDNFERYIEGYFAALPEMLAANNARVLPGVSEILGHAGDHPDVAQGLLTGNLRRGAAIKLGYHGLWNYFPFGAFADDSEVRNELGPHAIRRAETHWITPFPLERVWIVGDTPHDIACARAIGARALAVATGGSTASELAVHQPDALLESLAAPADFWRSVAI